MGDVIEIDGGDNFFPSDRPSESPTFAPVTPAPTAKNLLPELHSSIRGFDLSEDHYGPGRIPGIVIMVAVTHLLLFLAVKFFRRGKPFWPKKTKPLSGKDRERHVMAKCFLALGSFLAWVFTIIYTSSCKYAQIGGKYQTTRDERVAFGLFRNEDEDGLCEAMVIEDPAQSLVAGRVFSIMTCVLLGFAFFLILFLVTIVECFSSVLQRISKPRVYNLWIVAIALLYTSTWTTMFSLFFFGLEVCNEPDDGVEGQFCKKGTAKLSIYNIFFLAFISLVGLWYMWDALTDRPLSQKARANSMRRSPSVRRKEPVKRGNGNNNNNNEEDPTEDHSGEDEHQRSPKPRSSPSGRSKSPVKNRNNNNNNNKNNNNKNGKGPASVQTVKSGNGNQSSVNGGSNRSLNTNNNNNNKTRSPRPGAKRSVSANAGKKMDASERSPRPGHSRSKSAGNVNNNNNNNANNKSPRANRRPSGNGPSPRKPVPDFGGGSERSGASTRSGPSTKSPGSSGKSPGRKSRTPRGGAKRNNTGGGGGGGIPSVPDL